MNKEYAELLLRPEWKERRLQILKRDNYTCQRCGVRGKKMNVHHLRYDKSVMPWEYDDKDLITLCEECHEIVHNIKPVYKDTKPFWMFYNGNFDKYMKIIGEPFRIFMYMVLNMQMNYGRIENKKGLNKEIMDFLGISKSGVYKGMRLLEKENFIKKSDGFIYLNPAIVWRGYLKENTKARKKYESL